MSDFKRHSLTVLNQGFEWTSRGYKALLVTFETDDAGLAHGLVAFGIPLTAIKMLEAQAAYHYAVKELPEWLFLAIDGYFEAMKRSAVQRLEDAIFAFDKPQPKLVQ